MTAASNSEARKRAAEAQATSWVDRHGDVWRLGDDGLLHTPETQPFSREHVEKKWGPLRPVVDLLAKLQDSIDAAKAASNSESPLSQPIPAPVDSGAIGRLNEAERASCDGSGRCSASRHIHGCFADVDGSTCDDPDDHAAASCPTGCISCQTAGRCWDCPCHNDDSESAIGRLSTVLAAHMQSFGHNDSRFWSFCRCSPNVELSGADGDVPDAAHPFYLDTIAAYHQHVAEHLAPILREHTDRAWDEGYMRGRYPWTDEAQEVDPIPECAGPPLSGRNANPYRAARQEQSR